MSGTDQKIPGADASPIPDENRAVRRGTFADWFSDLGWRALLGVVACVLAAVSAPTAVTAVFMGLAAVVLVERIVRHRERGMLDAALVGTGMLVVVLGLLGLLLNYLPGGLGRAGWAIGLLAVGMVALTVAGLARGGTPRSPFRPLLRRSSLSTALWSVAALSVLAVAVVISVRSFDRTHIAPANLSSSAVDNGFATVTLAAGSEQGPFELDLVSGSSRKVLFDDVTVSPSNSTSIVVAVPPNSRMVIQLVEPGTTTAIRELILDDTKIRTSR